jgi:manganese/iron transport system ATP-binding protein
VSALEVQGVDVALGGRPVLRGVDLAVEPAQLVGLLGRNGAGKTTLLRAVLGLVPTSAGSVTVDGRPRRRNRPAIGYVPQRHEFAWDFPISVERTVLTGLLGRSGVFSRVGVGEWLSVHDALDQVGLGDLRQRPVAQLSGGQRQRVLVARALVGGSSVLLLDEPLTGLDLPSQEQLTTLFRRLAGDGKALLLTTHDLLGALDACDRLVLLNQRVVAHGPPEELRDPAVWMETFGVGPGSPLLRLLEVA